MITLELAMDGAVMRMRLANDQAARLGHLLDLAQFRCWFTRRAK